MPVEIHDINYIQYFSFSDNLASRLINILVISVIFIIGCEDPEQIFEEESGDKNINTLGEESLGGPEGELKEYFYDFSKDYDARYLYYSNATKVANPSTMDPLEDTLNMSSFSEYFLAVSNEEYADLVVRVPFDETKEFRGKDSVDINNDGKFFPDSTTTTFSESTPWYQSYNMIEQLVWDDEVGRYKPQYGSMQKNEDTIYYKQSNSDGSISLIDSLIFCKIFSLSILIHNYVLNLFFNLSPARHPMIINAKPEMLCPYIICPTPSRNPYTAIQPRIMAAIPLGTGQ